MSTKMDEQTLKHLQKVQLMILKDFIEICNKNNLDYYLFYGTLIGAVRHKGFIPWDDDIDIAMFREDYEKFLEAFKKEKSDKYELLETRYQDDYFFIFGKMSLKNTSYGENWSGQVSFKLGIFIDIFVIENVPDNKIKRFFFRKKCFIYDKLLAIAAIKFDKNYPFYIRATTNTLHTILNKLNLNTKYFQKKVINTMKKYGNKDTTYVCELSDECQSYYKKSDLTPPIKVKFEDIEVKIPNNYDAVLKTIYGDYMKIPPENERVTHNIDYVDFGEY